MDAEYSREKKELVRLAYDFLHKQSEGCYYNNNRTPISLKRYGNVTQTIIVCLYVVSEDEVMVESLAIGEDCCADSDLLSDFSNDEIRDILKVCGII